LFGKWRKISLIFPLPFDIMNRNDCEGLKMKKIEKSSELLWLLGTIFVALGVTICSKVDLGVSMIAAPAFVVSDAIAPVWGGFTVGVAEYVLQGILLIILCCIIRHFEWKYLFAFLVAVVYGYTLDLFIFIFDGVVFNKLWLRWIMLLVGDCITAFGVACFFRTYLPLQVYELFVSKLSSRFGFKISVVKWGFDLSLLALSVVLVFTLFPISEFNPRILINSSYHKIGLGTLVTTAINSPIIAFMGRIIDRVFGREPMFPALKEKL
jgi:uncharacterized membrane protein YczE